jgi:tellurium resistance protein TerZ
VTVSTVNMVKGQKISLTKADGSGLTKLHMGLGWDVARSGGGLFKKAQSEEIDLDASCLMFDAAGNLVDQVYFGQLFSKDTAVRHTGDNLTGEGDGDDESIKVNLAEVSPTIESLVFTVNSFTGQTFERIENAFCRLVDDTNGEEFAKYVLSERGGHTAVVMAKVYRNQGQWKFAAIGENATGQTFQDLLPVISPFV